MGRAVLNKSNNGLGLLLFKIWRCSSTYPTVSADVAERPLRAPRANRVFGTDEKRIRTKNTVMYKSSNGCSH
jgi:hypothetical protein